MTEARPWWRRLLRRPARAAWIEAGEWQHHNLISEAVSTPEARRSLRKNSDFLRLHGAVFAAIRRRVRGVAVPKLVLVRRVGKEFIDIESHPALDALQRVNGSLTHRQGMGLIEQHKLTTGKAYWVKRRNGIGVVMEFEIWQPNSVTVNRDPKAPWMPKSFTLRRDDNTTETVDPIDMVWFRHLVDPDDPLNGLSPITAVRMALDTGIEAQRFNQRFFDNSTNIGQIFSAKDAGPAEIQRLEKDLERKFKGPDRAHRAIVIGGEVEAIETPVSHRDMEFLAQMGFTNDDVARVFEIAGELIGSGSRTYDNTEFGLRDFWQMIVDQVQFTADEFNEFFIKPDFGDEFELRVDYSHIQALQSDRKRQAEIDEINLRTGKSFINELRDRDGEEPVDWGDLPLLASNVVPLGSVPPPPPVPQPPRSRAFPQKTADAMRSKWARRLSQELRGIIAHLKTADARAITPADANNYDWDWWLKYGPEVEAELTAAITSVLIEYGFINTPLLSAQQLAADYAHARAGELLVLSGRDNIVKATQEILGNLVAETIEAGDSLNTLIKKLQNHYGFSKSRAETIARTETAKALNHGTLKSYQSLGHEGKEWLTAGDDRVCDTCQAGQDEGAIPMGQVFNNGYDGPPPHPNCRCTLLPVREMGRKMGQKFAPLAVPSANGHKPRTVRLVERDDEGLIARIIDEEL